MTTKADGIEFDPGFAPYILAFQGTVEYLYTDINKYKNLSQRRLKFKQYYRKFLEVFNNNLGFYVGCIMWAEYITIQPEQQILNNHCYGHKLSDEENTYDVDFMIKFTELFPKDMKYFLNEHYEFPKEYLQILNLYREFLIINKGFANLTKNTEILLPENIARANAESFKEKINEVLKTGDLSKFLEYRELL